MHTLVLSAFLALTVVTASAFTAHSAEHDWPELSYFAIENQIDFPADFIQLGPTQLDELLATELPLIDYATSVQTEEGLDYAFFPTHVKIAGDLLLMQDDKFLADGNLDVTGTIFCHGDLVVNGSLSASKVCIFDGSLTVEGAVNVADQIACRTGGFYAKSTVQAGGIEVADKIEIFGDLSGAWVNGSGEIVLHGNADVMQLVCHSSLRSDQDIVSKYGVFVESGSLFCEGNLHCDESISAGGTIIVSGELSSRLDILAGVNPALRSIVGMKLVTCGQLLDGELVGCSLVETATRNN